MESNPHARGEKLAEAGLSEGVGEPVGAGWRRRRERGLGERAGILQRAAGRPSPKVPFNVSIPDPWIWANLFGDGSINTGRNMYGRARCTCAGLLVHVHLYAGTQGMRGRSM